MNIKVKDGSLLISRKGAGNDFVESYCPYSPKQKRCGTWCPHFGEPSMSLFEDNGGGGELELCNGTKILFDSFTCEVEKDEKKGRSKVHR